VPIREKLAGEGTNAGEIGKKDMVLGLKNFVESMGRGKD